MKMTRMMLVTALYTLISSTAFAQTAPPPTQTPPPAQTPPPVTQPQKPTTPAPPLPTQEPAPFPAESKFAFINPQAVLSQSELGKVGQKQLEELQKKKQAELDGITKRIETLTTELKTQAATLSNEAAQAKQRE